MDEETEGFLIRRGGGGGGSDGAIDVDGAIDGMGAIDVDLSLLSLEVWGSRSFYWSISFC